MSNRSIGVGPVAVFLTLISAVIGVGRLGIGAMDSLRADAQKTGDEQWAACNWLASCSIWIDSKAGEGRTFFIRLPLQSPAGDSNSNRAEVARQSLG